MTGRDTPAPAATPRQSRPGGSCRLTAAGVTPCPGQTLTRARDGTRRDARAAALADDDITRAGADGQIAELASSQVLGADVRPLLVLRGAPAARDDGRPRWQGGRGVMPHDPASTASRR
jgi:hypothetical protein